MQKVMTILTFDQDKVMNYINIFSIALILHSCVPYRNSFQTSTYEIIDDRTVVYKISKHNGYEIASMFVVEEDTIFINLTSRMADSYMIKNDTLLLRIERPNKQIEHHYYWNYSLKLWQHIGSKKTKTKGTLYSRNDEFEHKWVILNP